LREIRGRSEERPFFIGNGREAIPRALLALTDEAASPFARVVPLPDAGFAEHDLKGSFQETVAV
jgi:hypothetical protein